MSNGGGNDDKPEPTRESGDSSRALVTQDESHQLQILVDLEKQRIDSYNRRTDVARYAIEMNDAADKRQFDYRMAELDANKTSGQRRHTLAKYVTFGGGGVGTIIIILLLVMAFFGSQEQSALAIKIFQILGVGLGGYGLIGAIVRAVGRLFKEPQT